MTSTFTLEVKFERLKFTEDCRPRQDDCIILYTKDGCVWCGVVSYPDEFDSEMYGRHDKNYMNQIFVSMFVNDTETSGSIEFDNIEWWHLLPLIKKELF